MSSYTPSTDPAPLAIDLAQSRIGVAALRCKYEHQRSEGRCGVQDEDVPHAELLRAYYLRQLALTGESPSAAATEPQNELQRALRDLAEKYRAATPKIRDRALIERFLVLIDRFISKTITQSDAAELIILINQLSPLSLARSLGALA